jgi:Zn-dependent protease
VLHLSLSLYLETSLSSLALHELAHVAAAKALGVRVKRVGVSWKGPYIIRESGSVDQNMLIALTGPATNLVIAACLWPLMPRFAFMNLWCGLFNLLPVKSSDGARVLKCYREWKELRVR